MAHFTREREDQDWYRGLKVPASVLLNIDEKTKKAVSGSGGTWAPSSAIVLGGAGLELQCGLQLDGTATAAPAGDARFIFDDDDYFVIDGGEARALYDSAFGLLGGATSIPFETHGIRDYMPTSAGSPRPVITRRNGATVRIPIRVPDGARLTSIALYFAVGASHANVPANLPKIRAIRIDAAGAVEKVPGQTNSTADADGWITLESRPATGADWYAAGAVQSLTLTFDGVAAADRSTYDYALEWVDESGSGAFEDFFLTSAPYYPNRGTLLYQVALSYTIDDTRPY